MTTRIERRVRLVTNDRVGGYSLSEAAAREIARRKGLMLREEAGHLFVGEGYDRLEQVLSREDPDLLAVVEDMGDAASGWGARLKVGEYVLVAEVQDGHAGEESVVGWLDRAR